MPWGLLLFTRSCTVHRNVSLLALHAHAHILTTRGTALRRAERCACIFAFCTVPPGLPVVGRVLRASHDCCAPTCNLIYSRWPAVYVRSRYSRITVRVAARFGLHLFSLHSFCGLVRLSRLVPLWLRTRGFGSRARCTYIRYNTTRVLLTPHPALRRLALPDTRLPLIWTLVMGFICCRALQACTGYRSYPARFCLVLVTRFTAVPHGGELPRSLLPHYHTPCTRHAVAAHPLPSLPRPRPHLMDSFAFLRVLPDYTHRLPHACGRYTLPPRLQFPGSFPGSRTDSSQDVDTPH